MLYDAISCIINCLIDLFGYLYFIIMKDFISFASGIGVGLLIACLLSGRFLLNLKRVDTMEESILVKFDDDKKPIYVANPKTFMEAVYLMALFTFAPLGKKKHFRKRDIERTRRIIILLIVTLVLLIILTLILVCTVVMPDGGGIKFLF